MRLTAAFAAIGAIGSALIAHALAFEGPSHTWRAILVACTTVVAGALGAFLARRRERVGATVGLAFVAGALNGALMFLVTGSSGSRPLTLDFLLGGIALGAAIGAVCAVPFVPALVAVVVADDAVTARPGSVAHRAQLRRVIRRVAVAALAACCLLPRRSHGALTPLPTAIALVAAAVLSVAIVVELSAASRIVDLDASWTKVAAGEGRVVIDYGVGDEAFAQGPPSGTYREEPRWRVVLGDPALARAVLTSARRSAIGEGVFAVIALAWHLLAR